MDRRACCPHEGWPCVEACPYGALSRVGEVMTVGAVTDRVAADKAFYDNSGGGVTFSGGEPFAQPGFLYNLLESSRAIGVHTAVETCGHADLQDVTACAGLVDLFLFDLKLADRSRHQATTGAATDRILATLRFLAERCHERILIRVPLVPGFTDDLENLSGIAGVIREVGLARVEVLPFHDLGRDKYDGLGRAYRMRKPSPAGPAPAVEMARTLFARQGIACSVSYSL
jgi:pyruvate formate lyase activating enzyme